MDNVKLSAGGSGNEMRANCPFCDDSKSHLYINKIKPVYKCFKCEEVGTWAGLIMAVEGCTFMEAIAILAGASNVTEYGSIKKWLHNYVRNLNKEEVQLPVEKAELPDFKDIEFDGDYLNRLIVRYLKRRKISDRLLRSGLFKTLYGEMRVYIMASDNFWQGRALIPGQEPKYKNPTKTKKGVIGLLDNSLLTMPQGPLWLVEGVFSGLALLRQNKPVGAILGKTADDFQKHRLVDISNERGLVIALDSDATNLAWELGESLQEIGARNIEIAVLEDGDPEDNPHDFEIFSMYWKDRLLYSLRK